MKTLRAVRIREPGDREDDMRAAYAFFAATLGGSVAS